MKSRILVIALSVVVLTACNGGGDVPVVVITPTTPVSTIAPTTPDPLATTTKFGESHILPKGATSGSSTTINNVQHLNELIVYVRDNKGNYTHTYVYDDNNPAWNKKTDGSYEVTNIGTTMSYARFGMVKDNSAGHQVAFYQGHQTPSKDVPVTGTVVYHGASIYTCKTCNGFKTGDARITANFGSKSLTGYLAGIGEKGESGVILASIVGNTFASNSPFEGTSVKGAFFGLEAEEVSGIFINEMRGTAGAFGGKK